MYLVLTMVHLKAVLLAMVMDGLRVEKLGQKMDSGLDLVMDYPHCVVL